MNWVKILGMPEAASEHAGQIDVMQGWIHVMMVVLFIGWIAFFFYTLIRFRASKNPVADYVGVKSHNSTYHEIIVVVLEAVFLFGFSIPLWAQRVSNFPTEEEATTVRVIAEQFAWNVHYPGPDGIFGKTDITLLDPISNTIGLDPSDPNSADDIVTLNQLHLPVEKPALIHLTSKDVIHCFALQEMRVKQDIIPGMMIPAWFVPNVTTQQMRTIKGNDEDLREAIMADDRGQAEIAKAVGISESSLSAFLSGGSLEMSVYDQLARAVRVKPFKYEIACAQLCGLTHYRMRGYLTIHTQDGYEAWLKENAPEKR